MKVTILGCGGSGGVPLIGDYWGACNPRNPKNRRLRVSILAEEGETTILVDTSPDLRQQALAARLSKLDAVLFTHAHADHLNGIDDLRPVNRLIDRPYSRSLHTNGGRACSASRKARLVPQCIRRQRR